MTRLIMQAEELRMAMAGNSCEGQLQKPVIKIVILVATTIESAEREGRSIQCR